MGKVKEKLKAFPGKAKELLKKLSKKVIIIAAAVLVLLIAALALVIKLNQKEYATLVSGVSMDEAAAVLSYLDSQGITDYKVENNDTILVPENRRAALQAGVLMQGLTQTGFYYNTYFDHISALSTEAERNNALLMDLQDRMRATIRCFENVKDAVVTITPGTDNNYILDSNRMIEAKATVMVTMEEGKKLETQQASAIRELVSNAVQGLSVDSVSVTDTFGNRYSTGEITVDADASALKIQLEEEWENKIRTNVVQVLAPMYGEENVFVAVNCVVDVSTSTEDRTEYWGPDWMMDGSTGGRGIIGSMLWQWSYERDPEEGAGGVVGTEPNSDLPEYIEDQPDLNGSEGMASGSGQKDFDNNESNKHIVTTAGFLTDCSVAVSINSAVASDANLETIRQHVARASGIVGPVDAETGEEILSNRISVVTEEFYRPVEAEPDDGGGLTIPPWVLIAAAAGLVLFLIILIVVLLLLRRRRKRQEAEALALAEQEQQSEVDALLAAAGFGEPGAQAGADVMELQTERSMELRKSIRQFASDNPEIAAQMVRNWLRGGDENG